MAFVTTFAYRIVTYWATFAWEGITYRTAYAGAR